MGALGMKIALVILAVSAFPAFVLRAEKLPDSTCGCVPYYTSGVCHQRMCEDGYLVLEQDGECKCTNTCDGKECKLPHIPMIDYRREVEGLCKCIMPPKEEL